MEHSEVPELWEDWWQVVHIGNSVIDAFTLGPKVKVLDAYGTLPDCKAFRERGRPNRELYVLQKIEPYNAADWAGETGAVKAVLSKGCESHRADIQISHSIKRSRKC